MMRKADDGQWIETCIYCQTKQNGGQQDRVAFAEELKRLGWRWRMYARICPQCAKELRESGVPG